VCAYRPGERHLVDSVRPLCERLFAVERRFATDMGRVRRTTEVGATGLRMLSTGFPVPVVKLRRIGIRRAILDARRDHAFDVAHVELATMAQYVEHFGELPSVLVDHEAGGSGEEPARWEAYVREVYPRFTRCLTLSRDDGDHLRSIVPDLATSTRPPGVTLPPEPARHPEPDRVLFFGSPDHLPNRDALQWLADEVAPALLTARPGARVACAGFPHDHEMAKRAAAAGVEVLGFVDDLGAELDRASVVIAPVRLGRGVRVKNLEALSRAAPLVTTTLGRRGLDEMTEGVIAVADDAAGLAACTADLLSDPDRAAARGREGRAEVARLFTFERQARITMDLWRELG
jgi:glycosyltransferase involved in cell wall biosynthesis